MLTFRTNNKNFYLNILNDNHYNKLSAGWVLLYTHGSFSLKYKSKYSYIGTILMNINFQTGLG